MSQAATDGLPPARIWSADERFRNRVLGGTWLLFFILVALGVHGSSISILATHGNAPDSPIHLKYVDYFLEPAGDLLKSFTRGKSGEVPRLLGSEKRNVRADDWLVGTPWALSQLSHSPKFPVVNTNIGIGQNMLLVHNAPVLHVASIARPSSWGYMLLGPARGLAWQWWFQVFACFTALYLLFEIVVKDPRLAFFGAFWFCGSAFVVAWSLWPAYAVFFPALGCVCAYHVLNSQSTRTQIVSGVLLGWSAAGFFMFLYPPWQVPLGYFFLFVLVGLAVRDGLRPRMQGSMILSLSLAVVIAAALIGAFVHACAPAISALSHTAYPGERVYAGGGMVFGRMLKGWYNLITLYVEKQEYLTNESEASSFFHLYPALFFGLLLCSGIRRSLGAVGAAVAAFLLILLIFMAVPLPAVIAKVSLLSYTTAARLDLCVGLASITLTILVLGASRSESEEKGKLERIAPWLAGAFVFVFFLFNGIVVMKSTEMLINTTAVLLVALGAAFLSYLLLSGRRTEFAVLMSLCVVGTSVLFNPLCQGLKGLYENEMAVQIAQITAPGPAESRQRWVCYGDTGAAIAQVVGAPTINGTHFHPQLELWRQLDPEHKFEQHYNRYARIAFGYGETDSLDKIAFTSFTDQVYVGGSPLHPLMKKLGVRYVLAQREWQKPLAEQGMKVRYKSPAGHFTIFEAE